MPEHWVCSLMRRLKIFYGSIKIFQFILIIILIILFTLYETQQLISNILSLQVQCKMSDYEFFSKDPSQWGEAFQSLWGHLNICPLLNQFHVASITHLKFSSLTSLKAWENAEKFCSDVTFLLVLTEEGAAGDRVYGLSMIWVNPYQARISTMEKAVKQPTALVSTGPDWPYSLVQLNGDACHVPLLREGHLSILLEGGTSSATCGRVSQLEVHQLLSSSSHVVYPVGVNGCEIPVIASPSPWPKVQTCLEANPFT